jgi:hypothetical protein
MRRLAPVAVLTAALLLPVALLAQTPTPAKPDAPATKPKYDENTPFGVLMKDPAAKTVLIDDWPLVVSAIEMGGVPATNTMKDAFASDSARSQGGLTDALYARIIADLKRL